VLAISVKDLEIKIAQPGMGMGYRGVNMRLRSEAPDLEFTNINDAIRNLYEWYCYSKHLIWPEALLFDK